MNDSLLIWGFRTKNIEAVKAKLESRLGIAFEVWRDDDTGVHYITDPREPPQLELHPNLDIDEEGEFFTMEQYSEYPIILVITNIETRSGIVDEILSIPELGAELLERDEA